MNIAMTAATGKVGTAILAAAGARNLPIRALVREPSRLKGPASATARFDFADRATHAPALASVDTLILISPSTPEQVLQESAVIDAARAAGVRHVIRLSGAGAEHGGNRFSDQHRAVESHLRESGLHATILRATFFMENALGSAAPIAAGTYPAPLGNARLGQIAVADIAAAALAVAVASEAQRATYTLTGPAAYTGEEIASALSEAAGHPVRYFDVPEGAFRQNLVAAKLDPFTIEGLVEAFRLVRAGGSAAITEDVLRITGKKPLGFAEWAHAQRAAFRAPA